MALLSFPSVPFNGQIYPVNPLVDQHQYKWIAADNTWILLGLGTGVQAGTYGDEYNVPQFTVDAVGRISFAQNVPIALASTTKIGLVLLNDSVTSTSITEAATPNAVKTAYDLADAAVPKSAYTALGDILIGTGSGAYSALPVGSNGQALVVDSTSPAGVSWGSVGASSVALSPPINGNTNVQTALEDAVYDITSTGLTVTVTSTPTGLFNVEVTQATETQLGGAEIATQVETETGTDDTLIVTPLKLRTAAVYKSDFNAKGDILTASADDTPVILPVGLDGQYLKADSTTATGLAWSAPAFYNIDDISAGFDGVAVAFPLAVGGVAYTPTPASNIMVFLGGVPQTPGSAYTVVGSTLTFSSAPEAGTNFYATTIY